MKATSNALKAGKPEMACTSIHKIENGLYEWQEFARGNQPAMIEELLRGVESFAFQCQRQAQNGEAPTIDIAALRTSYEAWATYVTKTTTSESSFGKLFLWFFGFMVLGGFLMYARRKFREA